MSEIYYGKLYLSNDDIRRLHGLSEDSIVIVHPTNDGVEFLIGSTELKPFMSEGVKNFQNTRKVKLFNTEMNKETIELIVNKLDVAEDELLYASGTGDDSNRDFYIKNAIRFIREAIEMLK